MFHTIHKTSDGLLIKLKVEVLHARLPSDEARKSIYDDNAVTDKSLHRAITSLYLPKICNKMHAALLFHANNKFDF